MQGGQIRRRALHGVKLRGQHMAAGVIDEGDQAALGRALLKPGVGAAIDLHQLAQA